MRRAERFREQLAGASSGVVFLSRCLLNQNVRYLGGAGRAGGAAEFADSYLGRGIGICQLPLRQQRACGGVSRRHILVAYGPADALRPGSGAPPPPSTSA